MTLRPAEMRRHQLVGNELTSRIGQVLCGRFQHKNTDGSVFTPTITSAYIWPGVAHAVVIDPNKLWHFNIADMKGQNTLSAMSMMVGKPVRAIERIPTATGFREGLAYVVLLNENLLSNTTSPTLSAPLPKMVEIDLNDRPAGDYMIGFGVSGQGVVWESLTTMTHMLVAGSSDSGKSAFLRSLLYQLANLPPDQPVELFLTDLEGLTFSWAENWSMLKVPTAGNVEEATKVTNILVTEMDRRAGLYRASGKHPEKWSEYRAMTGETLPWIVAVFDEASALAEQAGKSSRLMYNLSQLTMRARKFGITLVFAGQDFKADLFVSRTTNQIKTRVQFRCATREQSESVLEVGGAEKLVEPGRALVRMYGKLTEIQTFWVPKSVVLGDAQPVEVGYAEPDRELTLDEFRLALWALDHPDQFHGGMQQAKLIEVFDRDKPLDGGLRITAWHIVQGALTSLKSRGLLSKRTGSGTTFYMTNELTELVVCERDARGKALEG